MALQSPTHDTDAVLAPRAPTPRAMAPADLDALAVEVAAALPSLDEDQRRVGLAVYRLLADGRPATAGTVAAQLGDVVGTVAPVLAALPTATVSDGAVVAFLGLQRAEGRHVLQFDDTALATWCAWDTLFLPALVGRAAVARSRCPATGEEVVVEVDPAAGVTSATPGDAVLSFLAHPTPFGGDVVAGFCRFIHFFADPDATEAWRTGSGGPTEVPELTVLSLGDGVALGARTNRLVFGKPS